jgi:hypothetical protein
LWLVALAVVEVQMWEMEVLVVVEPEVIAQAHRYQFLLVRRTRLQ